MPIDWAVLSSVSPLLNELRKTMLKLMAKVTTTGRSRREMTFLRLKGVPSLLILIASHHFRPGMRSLTDARAINGENAMTSHRYHILMMRTTHNTASGMRYASPIRVFISVSMTIDASVLGTPICMVERLSNDE